MKGGYSRTKETTPGNTKRLFDGEKGDQREKSVLSFWLLCNPVLTWQNYKRDTQTKYLKKGEQNHVIQEEMTHLRTKWIDILNTVSAVRYRKHSTRRNAFKIKISGMTACLTLWKITLSGYWKDVRGISNRNKENYALKKKTEANTKFR